MSPWARSSLTRSASLCFKRHSFSPRKPAAATTTTTPSSASFSSLATPPTDDDDDNASSSSTIYDDASSSSLLAADRRHVIHPYSSMTNPLPTYPVASASGIRISLEDGRQLIDGMSSWWAAVHGYRHPVIDAAVREQLEERMSHVMFGGLTHRPAVELCERLVGMVNEKGSSIADDGGDGALSKVFLCDSGSVSVEVAMKMAVQYWFTVGQPAKTKFVSLKNGYHGDTFGAMSVCDPVNGMHAMFSGLLATQIFVDSPTGPMEEDAAETVRQIESILAGDDGETVAAIIMEPIVQGAGGMKFYHPSLLRKVRECCDRHGALLIFDEIATGFGRTGSMFAFQQNEDTYRPWSSSPLPSLNDETLTDDTCSDGGKNKRPTPSPPVYPDILCLGKALTGGYMTLGATMTNTRVSEGISGTGGVFMHGPTFMGNPLACAAALASTQLLTDSPWRKRIDSVHNALIESLAPAAEMKDVVREVRVLGAIGVCELREPLGEDMARVQRAFVEEGVWLRPFGKLLYTMPPFNCPGLEKADVETIGRAICRVVEKLR